MSASPTTVLVRFAWRRHRATFLLLWLVPVAIGVVSGLLYPTYAENREAIRPLIKIFARVLDDDAVDFLSPQGFFNLPFRHPLTFLVFAMAAGVPALTMPASDRGRGALDVLLATPLSRRGVIRAAALTSIGAILAVCTAPLVGIVCGAACAGVTDAVPMKTYLVVAAAAAAFAASLSGAALWIAARSDDAPSAIGRYAAFFVVAMLLDALSMLWKGGEAIRWFTPGGYYRATEIVGGKANLPLSFGVLLGLAALGYALAVRAAESRRRA